MKKITQLLATLALTALLAPAIAAPTPNTHIPGGEYNGYSDPDGTHYYIDAASGASIILRHINSIPFGPDLSDVSLTINTDNLAPGVDILFNPDGTPSGGGYNTVNFTAGMWFSGNSALTLRGDRVNVLRDLDVHTDGAGKITFNVNNLGGNGNAINKWGTGTMEIGKGTVNEYFSTTTYLNVNQGTLEMNGEMQGWGNVTVAAGATLAGSGTMQAYNFNVEGTFQANGMEIASIGGGINMLDGSTLLIDIGDFGLTFDSWAGATNLNLLGNVTLELVGLNPGDSFEGLDWLSGGSITGNPFAQIKINDDIFEWDADNNWYTDGKTTIGPIGSDGRIDAFEYIPEPTTWALMIGGMGALVLLRRRRA